MAEAFKKGADVVHMAAETPIERVVAAADRLRKQFPKEPCFAMIRQAAGEGRVALKILYAHTGPELAAALERIDDEHTISITKTGDLPESLLALPEEKLHPRLSLLCGAMPDRSIASVSIEAVKPS